LFLISSIVADELSLPFKLFITIWHVPPMFSTIKETNDKILYDTFFPFIMDTEHYILFSYIKIPLSWTHFFLYQRIDYYILLQWYNSIVPSRLHVYICFFALHLASYRLFIVYTFIFRSTTFTKQSMHLKAKMIEKGGRGFQHIEGNIVLDEACNLTILGLRANRKIWQ
ncbi:hypothetical protein ACJX0J_035542, partial [Zea mays]